MSDVANSASGANRPERGNHPDERTLSGAIGYYARFQEARGDSAAHRGECLRMLQVLLDRMGDLPLAEISPEGLQAFLGAVRKRPGLKGRKCVSDITVGAYHRTLAAFFRLLETHELQVPSPMRRVPKPQVEQPLIRPFSPEQVQRLLAQPDAETFTGLRDLTLMVFLLDTGCRISEALTLTGEALDLEGREARVLGKGRKERRVPFGAHTREWLLRYLERRAPEGPAERVFVNEFGEPWTRQAATRRIGEYGRRAGLRGVRASAHTFRHTFGVNWLLGDGEYKGDALSLQQILGHSTPAMTQRYVQFTAQDLGRLHARLSPADRLVEPPLPRRRKLR